MDILSQATALVAEILSNLRSHAFGWLLVYYWLQTGCRGFVALCFKILAECFKIHADFFAECCCGD